MPQKGELVDLSPLSRDDPRIDVFAALQQGVYRNGNEIKHDYWTEIVEVRFPEGERPYLARYIYT